MKQQKTPERPIAKGPLSQPQAGHPEIQTLALFLPNPYRCLQLPVRSSLFVH